MLPATSIASEAAVNATARTESRARASADRSADAPSTRSAEQRPTPAPAKPAGNSARLHYDQERGRVYVEIIDPKTGKVLQRLPPESAVARLLELSEGKLAGALFDDFA